jgi:hypothetical protein
MWMIEPEVTEQESRAVELVVNSFERNYRDVLASGFFARIEAENEFGFARRVALINNVVDLDDAERRAQQLVEDGELSAYRVVARELPRALALTGLELKDLGRIPHYSDCSLVAVTAEGSPWLLYWDADIHLEQPRDWISPSLQRMAADGRLMVANPLWEDPTLESSTLEFDGDFAIGQGFSDQVYLVRRADFTAPIYSERCIASYRYPAAAIAYVFEARVDSWMRHHERLRLTYLPARYRHPLQATGSARERERPLERLRRLRNGVVLKALAISPWKPSCSRLM